MGPGSAQLVTGNKTLMEHVGGYMSYKMDICVYWSYREKGKGGLNARIKLVRETLSYATMSHQQLRIP